MRCAYQFICDRTNTVFNEWFLNYQEFSRKADEEKSFLKKRLEALNREADERAEDLFSKLKSQGLLRANSLQEIELHINPDAGHLIIEPKREHSIGELIMGRI